MKLKYYIQTVRDEEAECCETQKFQHENKAVAVCIHNEARALGRKVQVLRIIEHQRELIEA
jgi:hypothetical protein